MHGEMVQQEKRFDERLKILAFSQHGRRLAVPLGYVKGIFKARGVTPVPGAPPFVVGVVYAHGEIVPFLALDYFWSWRPHSQDYSDKEFLMILLEREKISFGIEIESNISMKDIPADLLDHERQGIWRKEHPYILADLTDKDEAVYLLDIPELLMGSELSSFISKED